MYLKTHDMKFSFIKPAPINIDMRYILDDLNKEYSIKHSIKKIRISPTNYNKIMAKFYNDFVDSSLFTPIDYAYHYSYQDISIYSPDTYETDILVILKRTICLSKFFGQKKISIYLDLNDRKRELDDLVNLDKKGAGLTTAGLTNPNQYIIVTKKEEATKLILHELIHHYNKQPDISREFIRYVKNTWAVEETYHLYEAHCELISIIIHCLFLAIENNLMNKLSLSLEGLHYLFLHYLGIERAYSFYLTANILNHFGTTAEKFFNGKGNKITFGSIPSYNITRGLFFYRLDEYLNMLYKDFKPNENYNPIPLLTPDKKYLSYFQIGKDNRIRYIALDIDSTNYKFINEYFIQ